MGDKKWLRWLHGRHDTGRLFICFPHAGASATNYHRVSAGTSPLAETAIVQYPGRQDRRNEQPAGAIGEMAEEIANELNAVMTRPVALYGHSMGAILAFEVARLLQDRNQSPYALMVSGARAPMAVGGGLLHSYLSDADILRDAQSLSEGTDDALFGESEAAAMVLPALRNDYDLIARYRCVPGPVLSCPITAIVGSRDPLVPVASAANWRDVTTGRFKLQMVNAGHFFDETTFDKSVLPLLRHELSLIGSEPDIAAS